MSPKTFTRSIPAAGEAPIPAASNENHEIGEARQVSQGVTHANEIEQGPRTLTGRSDHPTKPILIDAFCGAGGCTKGYQRAGFYVIGVDIERQPNYCGDQFVQADALEFLRDNVLSYAIAPVAVHASPPCPAYSLASHFHGVQADHPDLVGPTRQLLQQTGLPWVIENVEGSPLRRDLVLCGEMFDLRVHRHRVFECEGWMPMRIPHSRHRLKGAAHNCHIEEGVARLVAGNYANHQDAADAMGIDWPMSRRELANAIPPAYTQFIGEQLLQQISVREAA